MKRKILSLALVLMMVISMIPMGAFAGTPSPYASKMSVDTTSITADNQDNAEITVFTYGADNNVATDSTKVFFLTSRATTDTLYEGSTTTTDGFLVTPDTATGKAVINLKTGTSGNIKVAAFIVPSSFNQYTSTNLADYRAVLNGNTTNTLNATSLQMIKSYDITADGGAGKSMESRVSKYKVKGTEYSSAQSSSPLANGIDYYEYTYRLRSGGTNDGPTGAPVAGQIVKFTASSSYVSFDKQEATTDAGGEVKVKVYSTKPDTYKIQATVGSVSKEVTGVVFDATTATNIVLDSSQDAKVATGDTVTATIKLFDANNNQVIAPVGVTKTWADAQKIEVNRDGFPTGHGTTASSVTYDRNSSGYLKVKVGPLNKEGKYVLRVSLENGKKIDYNFSVAKQGAITGLNFEYLEKVVPYGTTVSVDTLDRVDANGVTWDYSGSASTNNFVFSTSDNKIAAVNASTGAVTFASGDDGKDAIGKTVTVTATDTLNKITKTFTMTVGGKASTLKLVANAAETGKDSVISVSVVDEKGTVVSRVTSGASVEGNAYILTKPEGASVGADEATNFDNNFIKYGTGDFKFNANKEGTYKVQIVVKVDNTAYSGTVDVAVGKSAVAGGKAIVLTMGSTVAVSNGAVTSLDVAPFIKDGRAFVPVSFVSAQLGGKAEFTKKADGTVDTVTVTVGTSVVTIKIGETSIKVVKDGKETTVTSDVAAFIKNGRTVLPFRAIADAIGAKATYGMKADNSGVEWVKFEQ